ncbi:hypothetical protein H6P81_012029 [Aristolochia fimbriata]|uniref:Uncharacterized protein n=1 Tax=Aristolochia fimbriata TaxID=158543 RepID=A0AAV7EDH3_ARIFI|nr:hypothetical protein H6P81_012029 [Aristolochia fimbriata]
MVSLRSMATMLLSALLIFSSHLGNTFGIREYSIRTTVDRVLVSGQVINTEALKNFGILREVPEGPDPLHNWNIQAPAPPPDRIHRP